GAAGTPTGIAVAGRGGAPVTPGATLPSPPGPPKTGPSPAQWGRGRAEATMPSSARAGAGRLRGCGGGRGGPRRPQRVTTRIPGGPSGGVRGVAGGHRRDPVGLERGELLNRLLGVASRRAEEDRVRPEAVPEPALLALRRGLHVRLQHAGLEVELHRPGGGTVRLLLLDRGERAGATSAFSWGRTRRSESRCSPPRRRGSWSRCRRRSGPSRGPRSLADRRRCPPRRSARGRSAGPCAPSHRRVSRRPAAPRQIGRA